MHKNLAHYNMRLRHEEPQLRLERGRVALLVTKIFLRPIIFILLISVLSGSRAQAPVRADQHGSKIDVFIDNRLFTSYITSHEEKYPFFFPVNGPSNASVTSMRNSNFPHHSSLFFGCDHLNGGNFWQEGLERGQILSIRADILETGADKVVIENECIWTRPGAKSPVRDIRTITIFAHSENLFVIDFDIVMEMLEDVTISRTNHSLFSGRMAADLTVTNGGTMINAEGKTGEQGTFGEASPWISYYGTRYGKTEGMTIMQHPDNKWYPAPWFTRDYGFFSPTPMYWPEDPEKGTFLEKGERVSLSYRVLVHAGDHLEADVAGEYDRYVK